MQIKELLYQFMCAAGEDPRLGPAHISLYAAILYYHQLQDFVNPICVYSRDLKRQAKVFAPATYHKCMADLKNYGYIEYTPSYNPVLGSLVQLRELVIQTCK